MQKFDLLIVGGGMVGLTTALAIRRLTDFTVAVVDSQPLKEIDDAHDVRVSAINAVSQQLFDNLNVWQAITGYRHQPYQQMHIWECQGHGKLDFNLADLNKRDQHGQLGWIIENSIIRQSLWHQVEQTEGIALFTQEKLTSIAFGETEAFATFSTLPPICTKLVIGADGARSWVREQANIGLTFKDYDHHAIVATIACPQGHSNTAWQTFLSSGPLAFLPLDSENNNLCSIVWSTNPDDASRLMAMSDDDFSKALTAASDGKFGACQLVSKRFSYPLTMRYAQQFVQDKVVLAGDAAHTIHPLAGQGVNLGLLDAAAIAECLAQVSDLNNTVALNKSLQHYQRWRKSDAVEMIAAMDMIKQAFTPQLAPVKLMRGLGMSLLNQFQPVKRQMIEQALGYKGNLPTLSTKQVTF